MSANTYKVTISVMKEDVEAIEELKTICKANRWSFSQTAVIAMIKETQRMKDQGIINDL